jgi:hypothetical protein
MIRETILEILRSWKGEYGWMLQAFGVVLVSLIAGAVARKVLRRLVEKTRGTSNNSTMCSSSPWSARPAA